MRQATICRSSLMRICLRSLLFSQYLNQRENQRIVAPFSVRGPGRTPFRMNPALRSLEDRIGGDKKTAYSIELSKNFGIVEKNIFGRSFAGRQSPGRAVMAGVELCFCTVCGYAVSHLLKWPEKYPFYRLLFPWGLCIFAAMFKASVIILGIIWASLLLISWGGAENPPKQAPAVAQVRPGF